MAAIVHLDPDDEITSAVARIRAAGEERVILVLPYGSHVATSRINFRLLAREAESAGRRLDIVAPDGGVRALAASAGLAVFASVAEAQDAHDTPAPHIEAVAPIAVPRDPGGAGVRDRPGGGVRNEPATPERPEPSVRSARGPRRVPRGAFAAVGAVVVVAIAGFAAWSLLPAAEITLAPRVTPLGPVTVTVRADPSATAVDAAAGVIPATMLALPVQASGDFRATGKRVVSARATGSVRLSNCDPTASYTIPSGTVLSTPAGIGFTTDEQAFLPVAILTGPPSNPKLTCQSIDVGVTAVAPGPDANVPGGSITVVPAKYNRTVVSANNPAAAIGGVLDTFPKVLKADVDAAVAALTKALASQFADAMATPPDVPAGSTVFPGTGTLGEATADPATSTLVGQEVASFTLGLSARGFVLAVDPTPVRAIVTARIGGLVPSGQHLVDGSISVTVGDGKAGDGIVTFTAQGRASVAAELDAAGLRRSVLGMPRARAEALLGQYGVVHVSLWPDWAGAVPGMESRVSISLLPPSGAVATSAPSAGASPAGSAAP